MKITIIGTGYVGLVSGACLANFGNDVVCLDIDADKIAKLNSGVIPIYEPGLKDLVLANVQKNRLVFTTNKQQAIEHGDVIFVAVGTPSNLDGSVDLRFVDAVAADIGVYINEYKVVVNKSTVPVGTAARVKKLIQEKQKDMGSSYSFDVVSNPEFLREGAAVHDFQNPDRVVIGSDSDTARELMKQLYSAIERVGKPIIFTDIPTAEMIKYASNAMLATRISFMNEISRLCEKVGADVKEVARGMGLDTRIGSRFLQAGAGYGGSCFPKDVRGIIDMARSHDVDFKLLKAVDAVNEEQKQSLLPKIKELVGDVRGKKIAVWGLAFKPKTDDIREAPSLVLIDQLLKEGASVSVFDPEAMEHVKKIYGDKIRYGTDPYDALSGADCLVEMTEWDEFREPDFEKMKQMMKQHCVVDGRNVWEPTTMKEKGFKYVGVGR
ncbi:MAG: UDP-glucose/GDP-mannose dehydrogenase family protein [Candidatus Woesearchaeota archaeon]|nr:UDP-glucose/GDP-mannose dehydrogenase family protein [Candidatus Woesearchaeota archaeon]